LRLKIFLTLLLALIITCASLFGYQFSDVLLTVNVDLNLRIFPDSSHIPGDGSINKRNTHVTLLEWPQIAHESVRSNMRYDYNTTRSTPVQFVITLSLDNKEKVLATSNLTRIGEYSGSASSHFSVARSGIYNLTITVRIANDSDVQDQLNRLVVVP